MRRTSKSTYALQTEEAVVSDKKVEFKEVVCKEKQQMGSSHKFSLMNDCRVSFKILRNSAPQFWMAD
jgi:hypothetical protein